MFTIRKSCIYLFLWAGFCSCHSKNDKDLPDPNADFTITFVQPDSPVLPFNKPVELEIAATHDVRSVTFFLDSQSVGEVHSSPYKVAWLPANLDPGRHKVRAIAVSAKGKEVAAEMDIILKLALGDHFRGGTVFQLDSAGIHGLIAADTDLSDQAGQPQYYTWGPVQILGTGFEDGSVNTEKLANRITGDDQMGVRFTGSGPQINGFGAWYIPSLFELESLRKQAALVGGFGDSPEHANYWSSTERNEHQAFYLNFISVTEIYALKTVRARVRPVRKF